MNYERESWLESWVVCSSFFFILVEVNSIEFELERGCNYLITHKFSWNGDRMIFFLSFIGTGYNEFGLEWGCNYLNECASFLRMGSR